METSIFLVANNSLSIQGILRSLCNPKFHYCVHNSTLIVHILSNINPIQDLPSYLSKISLNIIFSTTPGIQNDLVYSDFPIKTFYSNFFSLLVTQPLPSHCP
jgi:hypothetical protein